MNHATRHPKEPRGNYVVIYHAAWCGHCTKLLKHLESEHHDGTVYDAMSARTPVYLIEHEHITPKMGIVSYPTIKSYDEHGKKLKTFEGDRTTAKLVQFANATYQSSGGSGTSNASDRSERPNRSDRGHSYSRSEGKKCTPVYTLYVKARGQGRHQELARGPCVDLQSQVAHEIRRVDDYVRGMDGGALVTVRMGSYKWSNSDHPDEAKVLAEKLRRCKTGDVQITVQPHAGGVCPGAPDASWVSVKSRGICAHRKVFAIRKTSSCRNKARY